MLIVHRFIELSCDDLGFRTNFDRYSLFEFLWIRYNGHTSRLIIETILSLVSRNVHVWRILDCFVCLLFAYSLNRLLFKESNTKNVLLCCAAFLLFPMNDMTSAGFAATTTNYLWCVSFMLYSFIPFRNIYYGEKINAKFIPLYILSMLYACNQEQSVCIYVGISLFFLLYCLKKKLDCKYVVVALAIGVIGFIFMMTTPGNTNRSIGSTELFFSDYANSNVFDKIYLGTVSMFSTILNNVLIYWFMSFLIMLFIVSKKEHIVNKIISIVQSLFASFMFVLRFYDSAFNKNYFVFNYVTENGHAFNIGIFMLCILIIALYAYLFYVLFKDKSLPVILIFLIGLASRVIMGFSPTVFFSGFRTTCFTYFSLLVIIAIMVKENVKCLSNASYKMFITVFSILILMNYARLSWLSTGILKLFSSLL